MSIIRDAANGLIAGLTAAQFANDKDFATTEFVQRALGSRVGDNKGYAGNASMSPSDVGKTIPVSSPSPFTLTLPPLASVPGGAELFFINTNSSDVTLVGAGGDKLSYGGRLVPNFLVKAHSSLRLLSSVGTWANASGDAGLAYSDVFGASLAASGYQKLPSGLIMQWGTFYVSYTGSSVYSGAISTPIAFNNAILTVLGATRDTINPGYVAMNPASASSVNWKIMFPGAMNGGANYINWIALGY